MSHSEEVIHRYYPLLYFNESKLKFKLICFPARQINMWDECKLVASFNFIYIANTRTGMWLGKRNFLVLNIICFNFKIATARTLDALYSTKRGERNRLNLKQFVNHESWACRARFAETCCVRLCAALRCTCACAPCTCVCTYVP